MNKKMTGGWGTWSGKREFFRGLFHASIGLVGWMLSYPLAINDYTFNILIIVVGAVVMALDQVRIFIIDKNGYNFFLRLFKWLNRELVEKFLTRESEKRSDTTIVCSWIGLSLAWIISPRWIAVMAILLFSFTDPLAKLGKYFPLYRFQRGLRRGKSLGGVIFATLGGLAAFAFLLLTHYSLRPLTSEAGPVHICLVYMVGAALAPWIELYSGKLDNMTIPLGSAIAMLGAHYALNALNI